MKRIARFEKVSFEQFKKDYESTFGSNENILNIYNNIKLPTRATCLKNFYLLKVYVQGRTLKFKTVAITFAHTVLFRI